jgi:hypothetical protein
MLFAIMLQSGIHPIEPACTSIVFARVLYDGFACMLQAQMPVEVGSLPSASEHGLTIRATESIRTCRRTRRRRCITRVLRDTFRMKPIAACAPASRQQTILRVNESSLLFTYVDAELIFRSILTGVPSRTTYWKPFDITPRCCCCPAELR